MGVLIKVFFLFIKISVLSFGGGYAAFPIIMEAVEQNHWMTSSEIANILALAGTSPGPVAVNAAVGVGFKVAGAPGVIAALFGVAFPCAVIVIIFATFFFKVYTHRIVKTVLYILRPLTTGIIIYTAAKLALSNGIVFAGVFKNSGPAIEKGWNIGIASIQLFELKSILITLLAFTLLVKTKIHPVFIILGSGILGILLFGL